MLQCVAEKLSFLPFSKPGASVVSSARCMGRRTLLTKYRQTTIQIRQKPAPNRWTMSCLDVFGGIHARLQSRRNPSPLSSPLYVCVYRGGSARAPCVVFGAIEAVGGDGGLQVERDGRARIPSPDRDDRK